MTKELPCSVELLDAILEAVHRLGKRGEKNCTLEDYEELRELIAKPGRTLEEMRTIVDAVKDRELELFEKAQSQPGLKKAIRQ